MEEEDLSEDEEEILLERSRDGFIYVEDETDGKYEIEGLLGDELTPANCQVFRAKYTRRVEGQIIGDPQDVALKLARVNLDSPGFLRMRQEVEDSFTIGANEDQEHNVVTANSRILGIYKWWFYTGFEFCRFYCVSMPYLRGGSLRYLINGRFMERTLSESCIAVVLRETLLALSVLHARGKVHKKVNAGNIFIDDFHSQQPAIKLAYQGSTYFHDAEAEPHCPLKIWDRYWELLGSINCVVSRYPENWIWREPGIYEPNINEQDNFTAASDIWNVGVTALELALGPLRNHYGRKRTPDELRTYLINLRNNDAPLLPTLHMLFMAEIRNKRFSLEITNTSSSTTSTAGKMKKGLRNAYKKVMTLAKKVTARIPGNKRKPRIRNQFSSSFTAMVKRCLVLDPNQRPTADELLNDPFFVEHQNVNLQQFAEVLRSQQPILNR